MLQASFVKHPMNTIVITSKAPEQANEIPGVLSNLRSKQKQNPGIALHQTPKRYDQAWLEQTLKEHR